MFDLRLSRFSVAMLVIAIVAVLVLLLSSVTVVSGGGQEKVPLKKPDKADTPLDFKGELKADDPADPVHNEPCKTFMVKLKKGKTYVIEMSSMAFDSYLRLEDGKGNQLAEDDDSGGDLNAQIIHHPEADGEFKIIATRFDANGGAGGPFRLRVRTLAYLVGKAVPFNNGQVKIAGKLADNDPKDVAGPKHPYKLHTVRMVAGRTYTIDLSSDNFDTFLRLMDGQFRKLAEDDDSGGGNSGTDSRIVFTAKTDGDYHIVATTFDGQVGDYTLTVREEK